MAEKSNHHPRGYDFSAWYNDVIMRARTGRLLAMRGCR